MRRLGPSFVRRALRPVAWTRVRIRCESGFGLIELLIAMTVLSIAIAAQLTVFASSFTSLHRASRKGTAVTLADKQMEIYRTIAYSCIYLTSATGDSAYSGDVAYSGSQVTGSGCAPSTTPPTSATSATQTLSGPDGSSYRVDSYIVSTTPTGGRAMKTVTVVVRGITNGTLGGVLARSASSFDQGASS
jgi:prepilin-type N-terminal cleavage/methylation domain-containing protein